MNIRRPTVASETDYTYTDKSSGRQLHFTPKSNEMMVTFQETPSETTLNEVVQQATPLLSVSQGSNLERGFAAVYVSRDQGMEAAVHSVEDRPEIANSLPAMIDQDGLTRYFLPDEFTVQFREGVSKEQAEQIIRERGSRIIVEQRTPGYYTLAVPEGRGLFETIREFSSLAEVAFAEPSEVSFNSALAYIPDDPDFQQLWGLHNTGQTVNTVAGSPDADIDAPEAWDLTRGDPAVIVAVIDTGAALNHNDLQANILPRGADDWDFADPNDPVPEDGSTNSHGTHVSGTVAAVDNTTGVIGLAPQCRVMPLRVDLNTGMNQNRADAINYVAQQAAANPTRRYVINCSWRMNGDHAGVRTAIGNAVNDNVVVVFAAGNLNQNTDITPQFPGVYPQVIAVAALDQQDRKATFSNFGTNVDVSAPGVNIWSTARNNLYRFLDGTSMASPHVAGLAALVWSRNRNLTNQQVRQVIEDTCDNIDAANPGFVGTLGRGRVNAFRAVAQARYQFSTSRRVIDGFAYNAGTWRVERHPRFLADLTGDRRADIVGFGNEGVHVALSNGDGTFQPSRRVIDGFAYNAGTWRVERHPRFLADLTGDGRADIVGFGNEGVHVALSNGDGTFRSLGIVLVGFGYNAGTWRVERHPRFLADLTGDRRADIVGFGNAGVIVSLNTTQ